MSIERDEIEKLANDREAELGILNRNIKERLVLLINGKNKWSPDDVESKVTTIKPLY